MSGFSWLLLGVVFLFASLPFVSDKTFFGLPILKSRKGAWLRVVEFVLAYSAFIMLGRLIEGSVTHVMNQGWAFYAVTFLLFLVVATPAFIWRYLWK